jgi:dTDP-4-dehydrorhamnose reductase
MKRLVDTSVNEATNPTPAPTTTTIFQKYLVYGATGWIGSQLVQLLTKQGLMVIQAKARLEHLTQLEKEILCVQPTHILNAAGIVGSPNVDWCETNQDKTVMINIVGHLNLTSLAVKHNIHITHYATGCIYNDSQYLQNTLKGAWQGWTEEDPPNFAGSFYSKTKGIAEKLMRETYLPNAKVLILRVRMPISDDDNPKSFITKITQYKKVINIPNSMTVLSELLPASLCLLQHNTTGVFNLTNPGVCSHNEILTLYKQIINKDFTWQNFTIQQQSKVLIAPRSNCTLDTTKLINKLKELDYDISKIHTLHEAVELSLERRASKFIPNRKETTRDKNLSAKEFAIQQNIQRIEKILNARLCKGFDIQTDHQGWIIITAPTLYNRTHYWLSEMYHDDWVYVDGQDSNYPAKIKCCNFHTIDESQERHCYQWMENHFGKHNFLFNPQKE